MRIWIILQIPFLLHSISLKGSTQRFADKDFYLIDSLDLREVSKADSLLLDKWLRVYHESDYDITKVMALTRIAGDLVHTDCIKYQHLHLALVKKCQSKYSTEKVLSELYIQESIALYNLGRSYGRRGNSVKALSYYFKSLDIEKKLNNKADIAKRYDRIGIAYHHRGDLVRTLKYYNKAFQLRKESGEKDEIAESSAAIACVHLLQGDIKTALKYFIKTLKMTDNRSLVATVLNSSAQAYYIRGDTLRALNLFQKGLKIREKSGSQHSVIISLISVGIICKKMGRMSEALDCLNRSLMLSKSIFYKRGISTSYTHLAGVHLRIHQLDIAESYAEKGLKVAQDIGFPDKIKDAAEVLSKIYEKQNKNIQSFEIYKLYIRMKDSIQNIEVQKAITQLENRNILDKKEQQVILLRRKMELKKTQLQLIVITGLGLIVVLTSLSIKFYQKKKQRFERELNELRALKSEEQQKENSEKLTSISVNYGKKILPVNVKDVLFFNAKNKFVFLTNKEGKSYVIDATIKTLEGRLPNNFVKVHRAYIINQKEIQEVTKTHDHGKVIFTMKGEAKKEVPSSRSYSNRVKQVIESIG